LDTAYKLKKKEFKEDKELERILNGGQESSANEKARQLETMMQSYYENIKGKS